MGKDSIIDPNHLNLENTTIKSIFNQIFSNNFLIFYFLFWCIRFINIDQPILEGGGVRQILTASVSKFLFIEGISLESFLYPKMYMDDRSSYYLPEMPVYSALMALLCKIYGNYEEWIGRFISIILSGLAGIYFYRFLVNYTSQRIAKIALMIFCFSPLSIIYTRAIQPNPSMLFFLMATVYYFDKYLREPQWKNFCLTIVSGAVLFVLNASIQPIGILFLCLSIKQYGVRIFSTWKIYFIALSILAPCWLWIFHANNFYQIHLADANVIIGPAGKEDMPFLSFSWITDYSFYKTQLLFFSGVILTPIGFGLFILGLGLLKKKDSVLISWLISFFAYFVLINRQLHLYYYLPWLFPMSWAIARSISFIYDNIPGESFYKKPSGIFLFFLLTAGIIGGYSNSGFITPKATKIIPSAVEDLNKHFSKNIYGIISSSSVGSLGYYVDRKVTVLRGNSGQKKVDAFKKILQNSDPKYYLSIYPGKDYIDKNEFSSFLRQNYPVAEYKKNNFVLYKIE
tara:strand:+ start:117 stop:1655 length:1539 start_codon:yes stop_codon:yes gene_type:complete